MKTSRIVLCLFVLSILTGCHKCSKEKVVDILLVEKPELVNEQISKLLQEKLMNRDTSDILIIEEDSLYSTKFILAFYNQNKYSVTFTNKGMLSNQGDSLLVAVKNADSYGLFQEDYHYKKINALLLSAKDSLTKKFDVEKLEHADLLLMDAFFTMAVHINKGRINSDSLTYEWKGDEFETNIVQLLNSVITQNNVRIAFDSLEPKNENYKSLKSLLKKFKDEFKDSNWDSIANRESDSTTFLARVKERLIKSHDYFDEYTGSDSIKLVKSIKNFQCKNNLTEDGKIGKLTFKALQRTKQDYINQILVNMERWRWTKRPTEKQYVWVNIPKFEMHVVEQDTIVMRSRVIIGAPDHQTPLLKSTIRYFLIYPYWTVPYSIATKEILPILKWDTTYLSRKNFELLDGHNKKVDASKINWKNYSTKYFPWKLRQGIGEKNSLGILKFNFENKYGVYMHDTDNRKLFNREMRAMSHGCCRLEKFMDFAQFLIRDDSIKYPLDSLISDISKETQKYVYIKKPIALYFSYFTAEVDTLGELHYFIDVYRRDEKMLKAMKRKN